MPAGPRCSAGLPAAISGAAASRTAPRATCRFCDTDFVGTDGTLGGRYASAEELADTIAGAMDRGCRQPLRGPDRRRTAAAGRRRPDRGAACARLQRSASRPTAPSSRPTAWTGSASARRPAPSCGSGGVTNSSWSIRRRMRRRRPLSISPSSASRCSRWTGRTSVENTARAVDYCLRHPQWRLSLQTHKTLGIR